MRFHESFVMLLLLLCPFFDPIAIIKHKNIRPFDLLTFLTKRQILATHFLVVYIWLECVWLDSTTASALKMMDASVTLENFILGKTCLCEMAVNVRSYHE